MKALKLVGFVVRPLGQPSIVMNLMAAALIAVSVPALSQTPQATCESLAKINLPNTEITEAKLYGEGEYAPVADRQSHTAPPKLPANCRVLATIHTTAKTEVKAEVWLPAAGWNSNLVAATYPGFGGIVQSNELIAGVRKGYVALRNAGRALDNWEAASKDEDTLIDNGYRGMHLMTVTAKALIKAFYGKPVMHAYFLGCSEGGREGLNAAKHYPEDFDGIAVGGSGHIFSKINAAQLYPAWLASKDPARYLTDAKWKMVHEAVIKGCDEIDGVKDGVIENPPDCHFDLHSIECQGAESDSCITAKQVEFLELIYKGTTNPRTGELWFEGPAFGAELKLIEFANPQKPMTPALNLYKFLVFGKDPNWEFAKMDMDQVVTETHARLAPYIESEPKDMKAYFDRGGKLLIWDGWNDFNSPYHWIAYGKEVEQLYGKKTADDVLKLYFSAGMDHCYDGAGCDTFDKLTAISGWVQTGKAPVFMVAAHYEGDQVEHTRPMCQYPMVDKYTGKGEVKDAANWVCVAPQTEGTPGTKARTAGKGRSVAKARRAVKKR